MVKNAGIGESRSKSQDQSWPTHNIYTGLISILFSPIQVPEFDITSKSLMGNGKGQNLDFIRA